MQDETIEGLADKSTTTEELFRAVEQNWKLLRQLLNGVTSTKAPVRYGCAKVLMELSEAYPAKLYPYMDSFIDLLDSKHRILVWNALAIVANLTRVDEEKKFDAAFDKYFSFVNDEYMVTVANVVGHSSRIASAKPYLIDGITGELLKLDNLTLTPHLTEECERVIVEKAIKFFDLTFDKVRRKKEVLQFVEKHANSPRKTLRIVAEAFLQKHSS
jgi:hypothetical protein